MDYGTRRLLWQIDWVLDNFPIDPARLSILGHSGGARGASALSRVHPERFAAVHLYSVHMETGDQNPVFGGSAQNLPTTLPGNPGVTIW